MTNRVSAGRQAGLPVAVADTTGRASRATPTAAMFLSVNEQGLLRQASLRGQRPVAATGGLLYDLFGMS
jgi:hypothetical protein